MSAEMSDGSFVVTGCENGHVVLEVLDANRVVRFVYSMSMEEANGLAEDLGIVVDSIVEVRELAKTPRSGGGPARGGE